MRWPTGCAQLSTNVAQLASAALAQQQRRPAQNGKVEGANPSRGTISRRLASAGIADPGDLKSPRLPGASPGSPTGVWFTGNSRPIRLKIE
jgi:hypothetical protein